VPEDADNVRPPFTVLHEDNHVLAVVKPPEMPTMGAMPGKTSLVDLARQYLKQKYHKPGNVYVGVVSRLDAPVSGVVVLARTSKAAARLARQFREHSVEKTYWAIVFGRVVPSQGEWVDWVRKDESLRRMRVVQSGTPGAKEAKLAFRVTRRVPAGSLVEIDLLTGRKHQIRLQLAHRGHPVLGDRKYGSDREFPVGIALLARRLKFDHPVRSESLELVAPIPRHWRGFGVDPDDSW
jgi:23S rRNA pseudouridine1911/1915/1917 synthase